MKHADHVFFFIRWSRQCWKVLTATFLSSKLTQHHSKTPCVLYIIYTNMYVCNCLILTFCVIHCYSIIQSPLLYYVIIYFQLFKSIGQCMEPSDNQTFEKTGHFENVSWQWWFDRPKEARAKFPESFWSIPKRGGFEGRSRDRGGEKPILFAHRFKVSSGFREIVRPSGRNS